MLALLVFSLGISSGCSADKGVNLYFAEEEAFWLVAEKRVIKDENQPLAIINALLAGPTETGLVTLIPDGVRVLSLEVQNGIAHLDLSPEFNNVNYGSGPEAAMAGMIVNTLTGLEEIHTVYITVEGQIPECFQHIGSSGPFTWNDSLLKRLRLGGS